MIFLKEPGYYKDNDFGIRIEDIAVIVPVNTKVGTEWLVTTTIVDNLDYCGWFAVVLPSTGSVKVNVCGVFFSVW